MNTFANWLRDDTHFALVVAGLGFSALAMLRWSVRYLRSCRGPVVLSSRGEEAGVPEEPEPNATRQEIRDDLDVALSVPEITKARFDAMVRDQLRDLRRLPQQLQGYYVMEADR